MPFLVLFREPALGPLERGRLERSFSLCFDKVDGPVLDSFDSEYSYAIEWEGELPDMMKLKWLLGETWEPELLSDSSFLSAGLQADTKHGAPPLSHSMKYEYVVEYGPRLSFSTAWSTNATQIAQACGLNIKRIERSRRIKLITSEPIDTEEHEKALNRLHNMLHDRMTEMIYDRPFGELVSALIEDYKPEDWSVVDVLGEGVAALERVNEALGLAFDEFDLEYYTRLFKEELKRNPTSVELFDLSQSNSEHSRHWFFKGKMILDGEEKSKSLMDLVSMTLEANRTNSTLALCDNASAIRGRKIMAFIPTKAAEPSKMHSKEADYDITFTAETHNFPTGIAPFPGAETGTGGRLRDTHAAGRGSLPLAGTNGYSVGQLRIPGYYLPWEDSSLTYPSNMARPLQIILEASSGASDYANKFGEPLIVGFSRSFGLSLSSHIPHPPLQTSQSSQISHHSHSSHHHHHHHYHHHQQERREYIKPIMFTGGLGQIDHSHLKKLPPKPKMKIIKVGGPAYRIGLGGGAASSMVQGDNKEELDFNAVQRGDAEMEQKLNRVVRACVELGDKNPIVSIHDQGAGGNANVLKELVDPEGGLIHVRKIPCGDFTLSALEIWSAEYQENDALLIRSEDEPLFAAICERESCVWAVVGDVTGDGKVVLHDSHNGKNAVDLPLSAVLGKMPQKTFKSEKFHSLGSKLYLPKAITLESMLNRVLRHLSVGSKRFLTTKIDRSVTGLVAQQPCVGPLHIPLADYGATVQGYFGKSGAATSIGEQPILGLINPEAMARMTVGEALTNLVFAVTEDMNHIKASGNWMWPAKLPGEADSIYRACEAMSNLMIELGLAIDGGKDSLSMAAKSGSKKKKKKKKVVDNAVVVAAQEGESGKNSENSKDDENLEDEEMDDEIVKTPGTLVVSLYAPMEDVHLKVGPAIRCPGKSQLILVDLGLGKQRLGGSILAQSFAQIGNETPDLDDPATFSTAWYCIRSLIKSGKILSGHDRSDGGLATTLCEMAFSGNCGFSINTPVNYSDISLSYEKFIAQPWLNEELGLVLEVSNENVHDVLHLLRSSSPSLSPHIHLLGSTTVEKRLVIGYTSPDGAYSESILDEFMVHLRDIWESTSFELEKLQANTLCVRQEQLGLSHRTEPKYHLTFTPSLTPESILSSTINRPKVAVIREEGSNGDREMGAAFQLAGFEVWDIVMKDLISGLISLDIFQGIAFVGGFSYADVLDSAKGWAGKIKFNERLLSQFDSFINKRTDTFSLGICNGCQLMALLGYVPFPAKRLDSKVQPRFVHNLSGRFESRFSTVTIAKSPAIMLKEMEGTTMGIWVSHGEGRSYFPSAEVLKEVIDLHLAPIRYADDSGHPTEFYPFNPNGSPHGIAALCSQDGRHLAMMPHSERTAFTWSWPWMPESWRHPDHPCASSSPWLKMFQNAYQWCIQHK
jgi:phosphoribosylformylglycinamidine synthase